MWFKFKINCAFDFLYISHFFSWLDELGIVSINSSESIKISFSMDISINGLRCSWCKEDRSLVLIIFNFENILSQVVCVDGNSNTNLYNVNKLQNKLDWYDSSWSKINAQYRHLYSTFVTFNLFGGFNFNIFILINMYNFRGFRFIIVKIIFRYIWYEIAILTSKLF